MATKEQRLFCESLGISVSRVTVERVPHPSKRAHLVYRVSHPHFGEGVAALEQDAWRAFFRAAEAKEPLPDRCEGVTKKGKPCSNQPQKGERLCGPHLAKARSSAP
jgi:hypothetical protein